MPRKEIIGDCTLYLGDCLDVMPTLGQVDHIICDPPYEQVMQDAFGILNKNRLAKSVRPDALNFAGIDEIRDSFCSAANAICDGWFIGFCIAEGVMPWRDAMQAAGMKYKRAMVWVKPDAMPQFNGQGPSIGHEMLVAGWCGRGHSRWNGGGGRGTFTHHKYSPESHHPTQKPLPLIRELVSLFSSPRETVLDPFMGSGTCLVACAKLGRKGIGIEIDPGYFDIACRRVEQAYRQPDLFIEPPEKFKQESLL